MINQGILGGATHRNQSALRNYLPIEADPADWAEQQEAVPLPDDEYPRVGDDYNIPIAMWASLKTA